MFDRLVRYLPALDYIKKHKPKRILEVGSGSKGLGEFYGGEFWGADVNFPEPVVPNMRPVKLSENPALPIGRSERSESQKVRKLPFPDASFDLVVSIDTLEHVPSQMRGKMITELARICFGKNFVETHYCASHDEKQDEVGNVNSKLRENPQARRAGRASLQKCLIVGFPCGKGAEKLSKKMLKWLSARKSKTSKWFEEHVSFGLPSEKILTNTNQYYQILTNTNKKNIRENQILNNENLKICEYLLKFEDSPRFLKLERLLFAHFRPLVEFFLRRVNWGKCYRKIWMVKTGIS